MERIWVEVNTRVNYPIKRVLIEMEESGLINLEDSTHKFCTSWLVVVLLIIVRGRF